MSSFNYISSSQSIKIQCFVTNSAGQTAIDITEFYLNDSPFKVNTGFTNAGGTNNKEAMETEFGFDTTQWYDSIDDSLTKTKIQDLLYILQDKLHDHRFF